MWTFEESLEAAHDRLSPPLQVPHRGWPWVAWLPENTGLAQLGCPRLLGSLVPLGDSVTLPTCFGYGEVDTSPKKT